ncbi:hypothetical protein [Stenotrophomonas lactitubi]|uniref:hypothetical protein n=1 Tax=Stenotrophomonas lactitubi TaxID=2045214 RepID=UPI0033427729
MNDQERVVAQHGLALLPCTCLPLPLEHQVNRPLGVGERMLGGSPPGSFDPLQVSTADAQGLELLRGELRPVGMVGQGGSHRRRDPVGSDHGRPSQVLEGFMDVPVRQPENGFVGQPNFSTRKPSQTVLDGAHAGRFGLLVSDLLFKVFDVGGEAIGQGDPFELKQVLAAGLLPRWVLPGCHPGPDTASLLPLPGVER